MLFAGMSSRALEAECVESLVTRLMMSGCWFVYTELAGRYPDGPSGDGRPRVDVLAVPNRRLISQPVAWAEGAIAFEAKRPGTSVDAAVQQVKRYQGVTWSLPGGVEVVARRFYLWPMAPHAQVGERQLRITMQANRIGLARVGEGPRLYQLGSATGGCPLLTVTRQVNDVAVVYNPSGSRAGVRHGWRFNERP
jgi:hypothetical protein